MVRLLTCCKTQLHKSCLERQTVGKPNRGTEHSVVWQRWLEKLKAKFPALLIQDASSQHIGPWTWSLWLLYFKGCARWNPDPRDGGWKRNAVFPRAQPTEGTEGKPIWAERQAVDERGKGCEVCTGEPPGPCASPGRSDWWPGLPLPGSSWGAHPALAAPIAHRSCLFTEQEPPRPACTSTAAQWTPSSPNTHAHARCQKGEDNCSP